MTLPSDEQVALVAEAITAEIARQDGYDGTWLLDEGRLSFIDQGPVDMLAVARAAIAAMQAEGIPVYRLKDGGDT